LSAKRLVLNLTDDNVRDSASLIITMFLGICHMLSIPEMVKIGVSGIFLVYMLFLPSTNSIRCLMFMLSANELLDIGTTSLTMIFVALFSLKQWFLYIKQPEYCASVFISTFSLVLFGIIVYVLTRSKQALIDAIKHVFFLFYTAKMLSDNRGRWKQLYVELFRYIALGAVFFTVLSVAINGIPSLSQRFTPSREITINFLGIVCALAIVNLLYGIMMLKANAGINIALAIGCSVCGLLTQSRTFILAVAIGVFLLFLFISSLYKKLIFLYVGAFGSVVFLLIYASVPAVAERVDSVLLRILEPSNDDISNGRYDLWLSTIATMTANPTYFWLGAGDFNAVGALDRGRVTVAHNMFLETWVIFGAIGCILLVINYILYLKRYMFNNSRGRVELVAFVPLIVMLCSLFYSHHFIGRSMSIVFVLSFLPIAIGLDYKEGKCR